MKRNKFSRLPFFIYWLQDYSLINTLHAFNFHSYLFRTSQLAVDGKMFGSLLLVICLSQLWSHDNLRSCSISRRRWNSFLFSYYGPWAMGLWSWSEQLKLIWSMGMIWGFAESPFWPMILIRAYIGFWPMIWETGSKSMGMISNCHEFTAVSFIHFLTVKKIK